MLPNVIKRDGSIEKFSVINIAKVVTASGVDPEQAKKLSDTIATWAKEKNVETLTSLEIRDKVLEELQKINTNAAELYKWYEQSKEL